MAKLVKTIDLYNEIAGTRANATYAQPTNGYNALYTSANWAATTVTIYFEAVFKVGSGTGYVRLTTSGGSTVTTLSTTSTSTVRVRSSGISLTNATEYQVRIASSGTSDTITLYSARLVFVLDGTITACETHIPVCTGQITTTSTSYVRGVTSSLVLWESGVWDNATVYFEATLSNNNAANTATVALAPLNTTPVTDSALAVTGTTYTRSRSSALTLTNGQEYYTIIKTSATTGRFRDARLVVVQSNPTKTQSYRVIKNGYILSATTSYVDMNGIVYWDNDEFSGFDVTSYYEATMAGDNASLTVSSQLNDGSEVTTITHTGDAGNTLARVRSSSFTPTDNTNYVSLSKGNNGSYNIIVTAPKIISNLTTPSGVTATPSTVGVSASTFAPTTTITTNYVALPAVKGVGVGVFSPTISVSNHINTLPSTVGVGVGTFNPTIAITNNISVLSSTTGVGVSALAPTIAVTTNYVALPVTKGVGIGTFAPTIAITSAQTALPPTLGIGIGTFAPTISVTNNIATSAPVIEMGISALTPTVSITDSKLFEPPTIEIGIGTFAPTVGVTTNYIATPSVIEMGITVCLPRAKVTDPQGYTKQPKVMGEWDKVIRYNEGGYEETAPDTNTTPTGWDTREKPASDWDILEKDRNEIYTN